MIIQSLCNTCFQPYILLVEQSDQELLKQVATPDGQTCPCPRLCGGSINLVGDPTIKAMTKDRRLRAPMSLSVKELYRAVHGAGLPEEVPKSETLVKSLLRGMEVKSAKTSQANGLIYLHELHLCDGSIIHLSSGPLGAVVVKVTQERVKDGPMVKKEKPDGR